MPPISSVHRLIAEAQAEAARLVGQGEAEAARIANAAQAADPAFYQFLKTLETYRTALDQKTTLVLSVDSPFFKLLTQGVPDLQPGSKDKPPKARGGGNNGGRRPMIRGLRLVLTLGLILYLATGLAIVQQDEVGVVRRFGAVQSEILGPGLHWGFPLGLGQVDGVKIGQTRTITVGAQSPPVGSSGPTA